MKHSNTTPLKASVLAGVIGLAIVGTAVWCATSSSAYAADTPAAAPAQAGNPIAKLFDSGKQALAGLVGHGSDGIQSWHVGTETGPNPSVPVNPAMMYTPTSAGACLITVDPANPCHLDAKLVASVKVHCPTCDPANHTRDAERMGKDFVIANYWAMAFDTAGKPLSPKSTSYTVAFTDGTIHKAVPWSVNPGEWFVLKLAD